jgi:hypothetical protein
MATISTRAEVSADRCAYHLVRRAQASTAGYLHFNNGDLSKYCERNAFLIMAQRLAAHFFAKSRDLVIFNQVLELYLALLIMAPILQRLPLNPGFDCHHGHLIGFFRRNASGKIMRFHFASRIVERKYQPAEFSRNLDCLGIHDDDMMEFLLDLYRRHAGGRALKDMLAHQLFDPVLMVTERQGFELRHGNRFYRLEKAPFPGSIDLRQEAANVQDFKIRTVEHAGGRHLEIFISDPCLAEFRERVKGVVNAAANPAYKLQMIEDCIRDLIERIRPARSSQPQILELKQWLATKLRRLAGTNREAKELPNLLVNLWLQRSDYRLHLTEPNFFLDPGKIDEKAYIKFFSPYREVC